MIASYKQVMGSRNYWLSILIFLYPFLILSGHSYLSVRNVVLLVELLKSATINFSLVAAVFLAASVISHSTVYRILHGLAYCLQFIATFLTLYHFLLYKQFIGLPAIYALINTNMNEVSEFVTSNFRLDFAALSATFSFPLLYCVVKPFRIPGPKAENKLVFVVAPAIVLALIFHYSVGAEGKSYWIRNNPFIDMVGHIRTAIEEKGKLQKYYSGKHALAASTLTRQGGKSTHVLVIGEALTRGHMSLYGYSRITNPELSRISDRLYIASNACSSRNSTIPALKELLSFATREDPTPLYTQPNLLQIMRAAGYQTYWLSNQQQVGAFDTFVSIFADCADHKEFVDRRGWGDGSSLDDKLFAPLRRILREKGDRKFIVVHLIGMHQSYFMRYPPDLASFKGVEGVANRRGVAGLTPSELQTYNEYDNAVFYNDYVVSRLIAMQDPSEPVTVTYLSDHGESVGEADHFFGHAEGLPYRSLNEIPLFFYISEPYKQSMGRKLVHLESNLDQPFQSDQMIHSLLQLYDVECKPLDYTQSLFSPKFTPKRRYCDDLPAEPGSPSSGGSFLISPK